ncbi:hypothetical protein Asi03nite_74900 [Actinoplanes siamensis]|uniref:Transposase n=1 Tax=Actinoplanes siamensis TaxID=1223317 RepID=A0A919TPM6_9ACTN|nr:hypothetical protein [Actinoplanes siamensis]GIF09952.1 hypothetical protein Asi03nite_74900 [Actinoplanes siamensis]
MNRFQFVADHHERYGVKRLCLILGVARSSYYYWTSTAEARAARQATDTVLAGQIRTELAWLRRENAELRMRWCDVLKRSLAFWVEDTMGR